MSSREAKRCAQSVRALRGGGGELEDRRGERARARAWTSSAEFLALAKTNPLEMTFLYKSFSEQQYTKHRAIWSKLKAMEDSDKGPELDTRAVKLYRKMQRANCKLWAGIYNVNKAQYDEGQREDELLRQKIFQIVEENPKSLTFIDFGESAPMFWPLKEPPAKFKTVSDTAWAAAELFKLKNNESKNQAKVLTTIDYWITAQPLRGVHFSIIDKI